MSSPPLLVRIYVSGFTGLSTRFADDASMLTVMQGHHLNLSLPALSGLLAAQQSGFHQQTAATSSTTHFSSSSSSSSSVLKTLVSQALLSVARAAPGPFKEQVR